MVWTSWSWRRLGGSAIYLASLLAYLGVGAAAIVGLAFWARLALAR